MISPLILVVGGFIVGLLAAGTKFALAIGGVAGMLMIMAEVRWPKQRAPHIDSISRPKPVTRQKQLMLAAAMMALGIFVFWVAGIVPIQLSLTKLLGFYGAGVAEGLALAIVLTERRTREAHNNWLGAINPKSELEFDR